MFMTKKLSGNTCQVRTTRAFYACANVWTYKDEIKIVYTGVKTSTSPYMMDLSLRSAKEYVDRIPYDKVIEIKELV